MITNKEKMTIQVCENMRGGPGAAILTALSAELPAKMRLFSTITLKKGCGIGYHEHNGETELFYFVSGKGRVQDDDRFIDVTTGDCMSTPSLTPEPSSDLRSFT